jgi:large subunit ribosomal protein L24e|tara:strand:- start:199 stop:384 length:186 start_codon:yes stop_codon:yes gene_type:complete
LLSLKKCTFCGKEIEFGNGTMYIKNNGDISWFCSSKCRKNVLDLKRDYRKYKWARKGKSVV